MAVVDRFFNRALDRLERTLSQAMREAQVPQPSTGSLQKRPRARSNSALPHFRRQGSYFVRDEDGKGWEGCATRELDLEQPMLAAVSTGQPLASRNEMTMGSIFRRVSGGQFSGCLQQTLCVALRCHSMARMP